MVKPKKISEIKGLKITNSSNNNVGNTLKEFLHNNPDKLREFVNNNLDFDDMDFDIEPESVCCPFCRDTGYHGHVNQNQDTDSHNIYCYKCSDLKNNGHAYTPWDYLTKIYRIQEGGLSFLDAVVKIYGSFERFENAYNGHQVEIDSRITAPRQDKRQEFIDNIFSNNNSNILAFVDELYGKSFTSDIEQYIELYNNAEYDVTNAGWDKMDQNVQIFGLSKIPIKVVELNRFDKYVTYDNKFIRKLFTLNTTYLYLIPTVSPNGSIVQMSFRIGDGETGEGKPKVMKVKAPFGNGINIPFMFGFHNFKGFQYGMPIVLVEGEKDAIAMQTIYPYTLAMGRNTLGNSIKYLKYLTDKFIIIPDNDEAGLQGYEKIKKDMDRYGLKLKRISINNPKLKDFADVYTKGSWESIRKIMTKLKAKFNIN